MIFASVYPENPDDFDYLKVALSKLKLSDPSFVFEPEMKEFLGRGYRCGFLGTLHAEIVCERLFREFDLDLIISSPSVVYKITDNRGNEQVIYTTSDWPDPSAIKDNFEPWVKLEIVTPIDYLGPISDMMKELQRDLYEYRLRGQRKIAFDATKFRCARSSAGFTTR